MIAMFTLLIAWTWATSDVGLCSFGIATEAIAKAPTTTCFEFWFNRYQTLFAAMVAFATALIALAPARGQLREMIAQSQQRRMDDLRERHTELAVLESNIQRALTRIRIAQESFSKFHAAYYMIFRPGFGNMALAACDEVTKEVEKLPVSLGRPWGGKEAINIRDRYRDAIYIFGSFSIKVNNALIDWEAKGGRSPQAAVEIKRLIEPYTNLANECFNAAIAFHIIIDAERRRIEAALDELNRSIRL